jgi:hypothetical protein
MEAGDRRKRSAAAVQLRLEKRGNEVSKCDNGFDACETFDSDQPTLALIIGSSRP